MTSDWRSATAARIALTRTGPSLATTPMLHLRLAHALARDAVHTVLDEAALAATLPTPALNAWSEAPDRATYLMRPDLGRRLHPEAAAALAPHAATYDLVITLGDGLSARALQRHAGLLLARLLPALKTWRLAPLVLVRNARVATSDAIGKTLGAAAVLALIGERPGLSAPDSLGAYLTWAPEPGTTTDANRNCISNIRPEGLPYEDAAHRLHYLLDQMREGQTSGVALKDESSKAASLEADPIRAIHNG